MKTKEILTIVALAALGLCLLCSLAKAAMKGDKGKKHCDKVCGAFVFLAIVLLTVSQLLGKDEKYDASVHTTLCTAAQTDSVKNWAGNWPGIIGDPIKNKKMPPEQIIKDFHKNSYGCYPVIDESKYNCSSIDLKGDDCWLLKDFVINGERWRTASSPYKTPTSLTKEEEGIWCSNYETEGGCRRGESCANSCMKLGTIAECKNIYPKHTAYDGVKVGCSDSDDFDYHAEYCIDCDDGDGSQILCGPSKESVIKSCAW